MRDETAIFLLIVLVITSAGAGYYIGTSSPRPVQTTTLTSSVIQPCAGQVVWSVNSSSSLVPVLLMQPSTTAYACVTYQTWWKGNPDYNFTGSGQPSGIHQFYPFFVTNEECTTSGNQVACSPDVSHSFRVSAFPTAVNLTIYTDYVTVLYTITSLDNSTGYYSNSVPYQYCYSMPMAVGHSASDVNGSDFGPLLPHSCPFLPLSPVSVAVSGMGVVYLKPW